MGKRRGSRSERPTGRSTGFEKGSTGKARKTREQGQDEGAKLKPQTDFLRSHQAEAHESDEDRDKAQKKLVREALVQPFPQDGTEDQGGNQDQG